LPLLKFQPSYMANCWRCIYIRLVTIGAGATFCCSKWARGKCKSCRSCCDRVRDLDKGRGTAIMWTACTNRSSNHAHCCDLGKPTQHNTTQYNTTYMLMSNN